MRVTDIDYFERDALLRDFDNTWCFCFSNELTIQSAIWSLIDENQAHYVYSPSERHVRLAAIKKVVRED